MNAPSHRPFARYGHMIRRGGSRIFLGGDAPLRNDVTNGEVKKIKSEYVYTKKKASSQQGGWRGVHPLHPPPRYAYGYGINYAGTQVTQWD